MKQKGKRALTPKLRFPEFRDKPGWEEKELGEIVISISNGISLTQGSAASGVRVTRIETISESRIDLSKVGYIETDEDISVHKLAVGDILLSNINSVAHIGRSVIIDRDYNLYHGMNLLRLVVNSRIASPRFAFLAMNTDEVRSSIRARANKAVNQASINQTELGRTLVMVPQMAEQKKIAECLSSLDEVIAAEGRKLAALRDHKRGLMQQLFPQPGQTQPRLRFPEFRGRGEWEEKVLSDVCLMQAGEFVAASDIREQCEDGLYPCYGGNGLRGFTKSRTHDGIHPLIGRQGALCGNVRLAKGEFHATEHAVVATPRKGVHVTWLFYMLDQLNLNRFATGQAQPGLSVNVLENVTLAVPALKQEQRLIADCLTALDTQLAAQAAKIDALKQHKRGLMQQLFPAPEELQA